jgi:hypothetical protein
MASSNREEFRGNGGKSNAIYVAKLRRLGEVTTRTQIPGLLIFALK